MLNFFRKHQRIFFFVVTFFVVVSFLFFGTYTDFRAPEENSKDRILGKAIDGSALHSGEVDALARLLGADHEDQGRFPNLLNDGVIGKDLLIPGLGSMLAERYLEDLKEDLQFRVKKAKHYKFYTHPQVPFLSAEAVWQRVSPGLSERVGLLKSQEEEVSLHTFSLLAGLYVDQIHFPPDMLRRILSYQQQQYAWIQPDPRLQQENFALFGFQTVEDWLGPKFVQLAAQFILNAAILAEGKGYRVSHEEARVDLLRNVSLILQRYRETESPEAYFQQQIRLLGMQEALVLKLWRKVMLFRRYFSEVGNGIFNDDLALRQFNVFAKESARIDLYQLPVELRLKNFQDLLQLQVYLDAVALPKARGALLNLPTVFLTPEEVEKRFPELVQKSFSLEFAEVQKESVSQKISLKETWEWELGDSQWAELTVRFPILAQGQIETRDERFLALESLDPKLRLEIDRFARGRIVDAHPEWIDQALEQAAVKKEKIGVRSKGGKLPFAGVTDPAALLTLLQLAPLKEVKEESAPARSAQAQLGRFTADGETFYRIALLERPSAKEILTFAAAKREGILETLLDKRLEEAYADVRKKDPAMFKQEEGTWKPWQEVKDQIAARFYSPLLKAIKEEPQESLDLYAQQRFVDYVKEAKRNLEIDPEDSRWLHPSLGETQMENMSLDTQWRLVKSRKEIQRSVKGPLNKEALFQLTEGAWSPIEADPSGDLSFIHLLKHTAGEGASPGEVGRGQQVLSIDARRYLMQQVLEMLAEKKAIILHE